MSTASWRKAQQSDDKGGACVEVAGLSDTIAVRDSKDPEGPMLFVNRREFRHLAEAIKEL